MNGLNGGVDPAIQNIIVTNPIVELLEKMLAEAKAGRVTSVIIAGVTPTGGVLSAYAGGQRGDMYIGMAILQRKLLQDIEGPQPKQSPILRAAAIG